MTENQYAGVQRRELYSPRICPELIPVLYRTAKAKDVPMTTLVDLLLYKALAVEPIPATAREYLGELGSKFEADTPDDEDDGGELEKAVLSANVAPFSNVHEVEHWYRGSLHGLQRLGSLRRRFGDAPVSHQQAHSKAAKLLQIFRNEARRTLSRGPLKQ